MKFSKRKKLNTDFKMKRVDWELRRIVEKNLGDINFSVGSITGEYGNFVDEYSYAEGDNFTLQGLKDEITRLEVLHRQAMTARANKITERDNAQRAVNACRDIKKNSDRENCLTNKQPIYLRLEAEVTKAYTDTQAGGDQINRLSKIYNDRLKVEQDKQRALPPNQQNVTVTGATPMTVGALNNPPKDATSAEVRSAVTDSKSKKGLYIGIGLGVVVLGVVGYFVFRKK